MVERRSGRKIRAKGCYRDAVRSPKKHVIRCFGLKGVSVLLLVLVLWSRRVWALPFLTALCWPAEQGGQRRPLWAFSRTALWYTPRLPPVAIRYVLVADPAARLRMEAFFCTDLEVPSPSRSCSGSSCAGRSR